jgi:hypothetical protein
MVHLHLATLASSLLAIALAQSLAPSAPSSRLKIRFNPSNIRYLEDTDYNVWTIDTNTATASGSWNGVDFTVTAGGSSNFYGNYYKLIYTKFVSFLGERVIGEGITTDDELGLPLTLTIKGLSPGNHTLLAWHNCWDKLTSVAPINITVDGEPVALVGFHVSIFILTVTPNSDSSHSGT